MTTHYKSITIIIEHEDHIEEIFVPIVSSVSFDVTYEEETGVNLLDIALEKRTKIDEITMTFSPLEEEDGRLYTVYTKDK